MPKLDLPPKPSFPPLASTFERQKLFGAFHYGAKPVDGNPENVVIYGGWQKENIKRVEVPQLVGVPYAPHDGAVLFHRLGAPQLVALFDAWEKAGLKKHILTWGGSFAPRFIRGSRSVLSNHAFGTAFDINAHWNGLGQLPAARSMKGCLLDLVELANKFGFYWGGHFSNRLDGMHFELAKLL